MTTTSSTLRALQSVYPGNDQLAALVPRIEQDLASRLEAKNGLLGVVVGTADGRALAHAGASGTHFQPARIAAVASSLLALSESFTRETLGSDTQYSTIATARGTIMLVRVPSKTRAQVLCLWADNHLNLGMTLRTALDMASRVAQSIDGAQPDPA